MLIELQIPSKHAGLQTVGSGETGNTFGLNAEKKVIIKKKGDSGGNSHGVGKG